MEKEYRNLKLHKLRKNKPVPSSNAKDLKRLKSYQSIGRK